MNLLARPESYGGVHEIFFRKIFFSWFYSRYQNVPISHKKICLQIFPNTKGLATIRLQNRALSPPKSALFCSFIMDLPLVLGNFWVVIFFCLSSTFWYLDQFLKIKMMNFPCWYGSPLWIITNLDWNFFFWNIQNLVSNNKMYLFNWLKAPKKITCSLGKKFHNCCLE